MRDNGSNFEVKFAVGFILGLAAGLTIGLILTPKSGENTRELLKEKIADTGEKMQEIADDVGENVKEAVGDRKKIYRQAWKQPKIKPYTEEL